MISWPPKEHTNDKAHKRLIVDAIHWVLQWFNGLQDSTNNQALVSDGNGSLAFKEVVTTEGGQSIAGTTTIVNLDLNGELITTLLSSGANIGTISTNDGLENGWYSWAANTITGTMPNNLGAAGTTYGQIWQNSDLQPVQFGIFGGTSASIPSYGVAIRRKNGGTSWNAWTHLITDVGGQTIPGVTLSADLLINESADHSETPTAGKGQLWVKNDTPCSLYFTDDAGTDYNLSGSALTYVEGTWTPTLVGSGSNPTQSYNAQVGTYTRIGRVVYFNCRVQMAISGISAGSGTAKIGGLPITPAGTDLIPATVGTSDNWGTTKGAPTHAMIQPSTSEVVLYTYDNDAGNIAGNTVSDAADIGNQTSVFVSGHYEV